jgi:hypothetical protein
MKQKIIMRKPVQAIIAPVGAIIVIGWAPKSCAYVPFSPCLMHKAESY